MIDLETILGNCRTSQTGEDMPYGDMKIDRLFGLNDLIIENLKPDATVCEIGCLFGHSSMLFAHYCETLYCVDIFIDPYYESVFDKNAKNFGNIIKIKDTSINASAAFKDYTLDLVYIDAAHDYKSVMEDVAYWIRKVKKGGILAGHDYHPLHDGHIIEALRDYPLTPDKIYSDSSWMKRM